MTLNPDRSSVLERRLEQQLEAFDVAWQSGKCPNIDDFLVGFPIDEPTVAELRRELLVELIKVDLEYRWRQSATTDTVRSRAAIPRSPGGDSEAAPLLEDYLRRYPEIGPWDQMPLDLIGEEFLVRRKWGDAPSADAFRERFPRVANDLLSLLLGVERESYLEDTSGQFDTDVKLAPSTPVTPAVPSTGGIQFPPREAPPREPSRPPTKPTTPVVKEPAEPTDEGRLPERVGRYRVLSILGKGSFGTVYLGHDDQLERAVAIKVPHQKHWRQESIIEAFLREARLAAQLRHSALVEIFDAGRDETRGCFIVMEFIEGRPLNAAIERGAVPFAQGANWIASIAEGVHCAHKIGLVHCDLKPANILLDQNDQPHVTDFGLVISEADQRTKAGLVCGSPAYMAPEQIRGEAHRFDGRTDIWALGAILYELLTGRKPFGGGNIRQLFDEVQNRDPKPPRQINEEIPTALEWICLKCLAKPVAERYSNGFDLAFDLREALEGLSAGVDEGARKSHLLTAAGDYSRMSHSQTRGPGRTSPARIRTNLVPSESSPLIGREREVDDVAKMLREPSSPLTTLLGPGGMGKTRLSQEVALRMLDERAGGCWFADLTECRTSADIANAVAHALQVPLPNTEPPEQAVGHVLEFRRPILIVLDNFEQALDAAESTVGQWRRAAPQAQFLVTSRAALGLAGERTYELGPLAVPSPAENVNAQTAERFASLRLFRDRACEVQPSFRLDDKNISAVAAICHAVDGIPLAVELAAARVRLLTPDEIARRLSQKFQLLQSSRRDLTPRQQTLWGAIDWSMDHVREWELAAFLQACVFRSGFDFEAAEAVIDLSAFPQSPPVLDVLQSLRDKSLLTRTETPYGTRLGMYQSIREYGELRWRSAATTTEQQSLQSRLATYFVGWAESWNARLFTSQAVEALARLQLERENLFAVQDASLASGDFATAGRAILALARMLAIRGPVEQRLPRLERSLTAMTDGQCETAIALRTAIAEAAQAVGDSTLATSKVEQAITAATAIKSPSLLAMALKLRGELAGQRGESDVAVRDLVQAEQLARQSGDSHLVAACLAAHGFIVWQRGENELALRLLSEADLHVRAAGDLLDSILIARRRGHILAQQGDSFRALRCFAEAETTARELADDRSLRLALGDRANVLATQGDFAGALDCYQQAENLARRLGDKRGIAITVGNRGILFADRGEAQAALECYEQAEAINRAIQSRYGTAVNIGNRGVALADLGRLPESLACLAEAEALNQQSGNKFLLALNRGDRADVFIQQQKYPEAREELQASLAILDALQSRHSVEAFAYQTLLALVLRQLGQVTESEQLAREALALASQLQLTDAHPKLKIRQHLSALRQLTDAPSANS